jgi:hypothetical protein
MRLGPSRSPVWDLRAEYGTPQVPNVALARSWRILPPAAERVDVTCPRTEVERKGIVGHRSLLLDDEWLVQDGIPVTSPFRTIFDWRP